MNVFEFTWVGKRACPFDRLLWHAGAVQQFHTSNSFF